MVDYVKHKHQIDALRNEITELNDELTVEKAETNYYHEKLMELRSNIVEMFNLVGAETQLPDSESQDQAWSRYTQAILDKLKDLKGV